MRVAGQPDDVVVRAGLGSAEHGVRDALAHARDELVAQRGEVRGPLGPVRDRLGDRDAERADRGGVERPGAHAALLAPPCSTGVSGASRRARSAPTPTGPPTLWPDTVIASSPLAAKSTGTCPTACTASECTGMPCGRASCTTSGTGCSVPTSLFAHMTEIRAISSACSAISARRASRSTRPSASTGSRTISAPACSAIQNAGSSTAWCSTADTTMRRRRGSVVRRPQNSPLTARLSASVPPAVKTTSLGRAPSAAATDSRASSTVRRAARPAACSDDGLPVRVSSSTNASRAAGDSGVVAAWSR